MEVKAIAVIGASQLGRGIAFAAAHAGYKTVLEDISARVLEEAMTWMRQSFGEDAARGKVEARVRKGKFALISTAGDVKDAIRDAELIIETVPEELEMKLELFTIFDKFAKTGAIFASTASSLSISDFTDIVVSRDRCLGMRFFYGAPEMKRIELVRTLYTSDAAVAACREVTRRMSREVVVVEEAGQRVYDDEKRSAGEEKAVEKKA